MSWDIYVQDWPDGIESLEQVSPDFQPEAIGARDQIIRAIKGVVPMLDLAAGQEWGEIILAGCSIELHIGNEDPCTGFSFCIREINRDGINLIADILDALKLRAVQTGNGPDFFDRKTAFASYLSWRAYLDQIVSPGVARRGETVQ